MALYSETPAAVTPEQTRGGDILTQQNWIDLINSTYDEVLDAVRANLKDSNLMMLFREATQRFTTHTVRRKLWPAGTVPRSEDTDELTYMQAGVGFEHTYRVYTYRQGVKHERQLEEVDDTGQVAQEAAWLEDMSTRTVMAALADVLNRGVDPTTCPILCADGLAIVDSGRPNPDVKAGSWSNLESTGAITEDSLFTAEQNALNTRGPNGDRLNLNINKLIIPKAYESVLWKQLTTPGEVGTAMNDLNYSRKAKFTYEVVRELTANVIYYLLADPKSSLNEVTIRWRIRPSMADTNPENPDVIGKRIRFAFGLGAYDTRRYLRGGKLTAL